MHIFNKKYNLKEQNSQGVTSSGDKKSDGGTENKAIINQIIKIPYVNNDLCKQFVFFFLFTIVVTMTICPIFNCPFCANKIV